MKINSLSIVLPVFNEEEVIENVIKNIYGYTARFLGKDVEIIAVNDGSQDKTLMILKKMSLNHSNLKVISHDKNKGYGRALRSGIMAAVNERLLIMDSDGQIKADPLKIIWPLRNDYDVILGYRPQRADNPYRRILGGIGNTLSNFFLKHQIRDINCAFKVFKRDLLSGLVLSSDGGSINFEILYHLFRNNPSLKLYQFPIEHYPRRLGRSTGGNPKVICKNIAEGINICLRKDKE